jgi:hypothetical protein
MKGKTADTIIQYILNVHQYSMGMVDSPDVDKSQ